MTVASGMDQVTSRIAELQARLGLSSAGVLGGPSGSGTATGGTTSSGTGFSSALADALGLGGTGTTGTSGTTGTGDSGGEVGGQAATGRQAVALARTFTGVPYRWGGTDPGTGLDCSGLTQLVYGRLGVALPRVAADQAKAGVAVPSLSQAQPGDLVFFGSPAHHVGIVVGDGKMIDAPHTGSSVGVHDISGYGPVSAIRRVAPASPSAAAAGVGAAGGDTAGALAVARAELLSAAGLSSLAALDSTSADPFSAGSTSADPLSALLSAASTASSAGSVGGAAGTGGTLAGPYAALFEAAGRRHGVDPALLSAVARTESGYDSAAVSSAGARGLMQLMPATAGSLGVDPDDPAQAVDGAARLLSGLLTRYGGRTDLALAGYNAGPGAVDRYGGVPPYPQTRTYVQRVTDAWEALR